MPVAHLNHRICFKKILDPDLETHRSGICLIPAVAPWLLKLKLAHRKNAKFIDHFLFMISEVKGILNI